MFKVCLEDYSKTEGEREKERTLSTLETGEESRSRADTYGERKEREQKGVTICGARS